MEHQSVWVSWGTYLRNIDFQSRAPTGFFYCQKKPFTLTIHWHTCDTALHINYDFSFSPKAEPGDKYETTDFLHISNISKSGGWRRVQPHDHFSQFAFIAIYCTLLLWLKKLLKLLYYLKFILLSSPVYISVAYYLALPSSINTPPALLYL